MSPGRQQSSCQCYAKRRVSWALPSKKTPIFVPSADRENSRLADDGSLSDSPSNTHEQFIIGESELAEVK